MHCGGAGDRGENNKENHSEWDWSVPWASRTFSEEVPLSSLKERGENGDSKHGEQQEQTPGCMEHVAIHGTAKPTGWSQGLGDEAAARGEDQSLHPECHVDFFTLPALNQTLEQASHGQKFPELQ